MRKLSSRRQVCQKSTTI